jgi:hypothetical protein
VARKNSIFVSYSHKDQAWLERIREFLAPMFDETLDLWDDTRIPPGADWQAEINRALDEARIAILLVSPAFLASPFVASKELPPILERRARGMGFFWIPIRASLYTRTPLGNIQAAWNPNMPLNALPEAEIDKALLTIADRLDKAVNANVVANTVGLLDAVYPQMEAFSQNLPPGAGERVLGETVRQTGANVAMMSSDGVVLQEIEAKDFDRLDGPSLQLIKAHERAMQDLFDRWTETYPKRTAADSALRKRAATDLEGITRDLCSELKAITGFLQRLGFQLNDHYAHAFAICG